MSRFFLLPLFMAVFTLANAQGKATLPDVITIPVVVHVLYNNAIQNISDVQILSQLDALNHDYRGSNTDKSKTPSYFSDFTADCGFEFRLAKTDPNGNATSGIIRKTTSIQNFGIDDRAKSSANGGDNAWNRQHYLNIWVCNLAGGILGYTSAIGCAADKDGVVINYTAFGTTGTASAPFNLGRTATHEIGHWLNLRHLWGDTYCGDDGVDDTPAQRSSNKGYPAGEHFTCGNTAHGDMYMNFMDLTDDACMHMFTKGQRQRMRDLFVSGGARYGILSSSAMQQPSSVHAIETATTPVSSPSKIAVYPNPATETITVDISSDETVNGRSLLILNTVGQPMIVEPITSGRMIIRIGQLPAGMYYIKAGNAASMIKFIKH